MQLSKLYLALIFAAPFLAQASPLAPTDAALVSTVPACPAIGGTELTLPDVLSTVMCQNPVARKAMADYADSAAQLGQVRSALFPTVTLSGTSTRSLTDTPRETGTTQSSISAGLNYLVYDFGARDASIENAKSLLKASQSTQTKALQDLYFSAVQAYYAVFAAQESVRATEAALAAAQYSEKAATATFEAGVATKAEVLQAKTAVGQAQVNKIKAQGELRQAQGSLALLMGKPVTDVIKLGAPQPRAPGAYELKGVADLITEALASREDLEATVHQLQASKHALDVALAAGKPSISLTATTAQNFSSLTSSQPNNSALGVTVTIPVFTGFKNKFSVESAKQKVVAAQEAQEALKNQIELDVWKSYQALETNAATEAAASDLLASSKASYEVALGKYTAGVGTFSDVMSAQSTLASSEQTLLASKYALYLSRFALSQALGVLLKTPQ